MDPVTIILLVLIVGGYFAFYRPQFIVKPARRRNELVAKFEQVAALNDQLLGNIRQFANQNGVLDQPFIDNDSFRKKIAELESAREEVLAEENLLMIKARNPQNLDIQLLDRSLDDQLIYHQRIQKSFDRYKSANPFS